MTPEIPTPPFPEAPSARTLTALSAPYAQTGVLPGRL